MSCKGGCGLSVSIKHHPALGKRTAELRQVGEAFAVNQQAVQCIADAHPAGLGIADDGCPFGSVTGTIEVGMADACTGLDDRDCGMLAYVADESGTSARDEQVHAVIGTQQGVGALAVGRKQGHQVGRQSLPTEHIADERHGCRVRIPGIAPSLQYAGTTGLQAEGEHIEGHIGSRLVDDADDAEGDAHPCQLHAVGADAVLQDASQRRGERGDRTHVVGYALQAFCRELQPVVFRVVGVHACQVAAVGGEEGVSLCLNLVGGQAQGLVDECFVLYAGVEGGFFSGSQ